MDDMSSSLSDLDNLNESFFMPLQSVYLGLNASKTYYNLKQKSTEYLQSTLVFTKEREEVEKIAAAEAQREAEKTIAPLSRNASNESTYQPFRQGFRPMDIFFTTYRNFFITGVSQLLQRFD